MFFENELDSVGTEPATSELCCPQDHHLGLRPFTSYKKYLHYAEIWLAENKQVTQNGP